VTNKIIVGLGKDLVCWDEEFGDMSKIIGFQSPDIVASIAWQPRCANVSVGSKLGRLELVDVERRVVIQKFKAHCNMRTGKNMTKFHLLRCNRDNFVESAK
jgi:WD40 repeat protein